MGYIDDFVLMNYVDDCILYAGSLAQKMDKLKGKKLNLSILSSEFVDLL